MKKKEWHIGFARSKPLGYPFESNPVGGNGFAT